MLSPSQVSSHHTISSAALAVLLFIIRHLHFSWEYLHYIPQRLTYLSYHRAGSLSLSLFALWLGMNGMLGKYEYKYELTPGLRNSRYINM